MSKQLSYDDMMNVLREAYGSSKPTPRSVGPDVEGYKRFDYADKMEGTFGRGSTMRSLNTGLLQAGGTFAALRNRARDLVTGEDTAGDTIRMNEGISEWKAERDPDRFSKALTGTTRSLATMAPAVPLAAASGPAAMAAMTGIAGTTTANESYTEARDAGLSSGKATAYAAAAGSIEAGVMTIFNKIGLGGAEAALASKAITQQGLKSAFGALSKTVAGEAAEEWTTGAAQDSIRKVFDVNADSAALFHEDGSVIDKKGKLAPFWQNRLDELDQTLLMGGTVHSRSLAVGAVESTRDRLPNAEGEKFIQGDPITDAARQFYQQNPAAARDIAKAVQPTRRQTEGVGVRMNAAQRRQFAGRLREIDADRERAAAREYQEPMTGAEFGTEPLTGREFAGKEPLSAREFDAAGRQPLSAGELARAGDKMTPEEWDAVSAQPAIAQEPHAVPTETAQPKPKKKSSFKKKAFSQDDIDAAIQRAADESPIPDTSGELALISHAYRRFSEMPEGKGVGLEQFKQLAADAFTRKKLGMARDDLKVFGEAASKESEYKAGGNHFHLIKTSKSNKEAEASRVSPPPRQKKDPEVAIEEAFDFADRMRSNLVSLADLRDQSGLPREEFNAAIRSLRKKGKMSLSAGNGASQRQREAAVWDVDVPLAFATKETPVPASKPAPSAPRKTKEGLTAEQQRTLAEIRATKKESDRVSDTQALRGLLGEVAPRKPKSSFKKTTAKASEPAPSKAEDVPDDMTDAEIEARLAEVEREQEQRPEPTPADDEQQQFGAFIRRMNASGKLPKSFLGKGKITISDLWKAYRKGDGTITTRDEFNRRLAEANKRGDIKLEASKLGDRDSEIVVGKDRFHQVDFNKPEDRMSVDLFRQKVREAVKDEDQADAIEKVWQSYAEGYHGKGLGEVLSRQLADMVSSDSKQANRQGAVRFMEDGRAIISSFGSSDFSTHTHEFSHIARRWLKPSDQRIADKYVSAKDGAAWSTEQEEKFARGFEKYLRTGKAPLSKIGKVWDRIKGWMREAYLVVRGTPINVDVSPEVEGVYRRILGESPSSEPSQQTAGTDELYQSEQRRPARPDLANPGLSRPVRDLVDEADRGRERPDTRKDADVDIEANRLLRDEYQTTKERLLDAARTGRQLSDTETAAAQLLIEREGAKALKSDDDSQLEEAVALIDAYRWTGTEQARAFRQRRDRVETPAERHLRILGESVLSPSAKDRKQMEAARKDGNADALKKLIAKHREEVKRLKDTLRKLGYDPKNFDRVAPSAEASFKVLRIVQSVRSGLGDKVFEYWRNAILSAPLTQAVNTSSNALAAGWNFGVSRPIESLANVILRDNRLAQIGEHKYAVQGILPGIAKANANFLKTFQNEIPWFDYTMGRFQLETADGQDKYSVGAIGGTTGRIVRTPQRFISAVDQWFKTMIAEMDVGARAYRIARREGLAGRDLSNRIAELHGDIHSVAWAESLETADKLTFQEKPGPWTDAILKLRRDDPTGAVRYIVPFVMTPANIMKEGLRKSPLGVLRVFNQMKTASETGDWSNVKQTLIQQTLSWAAMLALFAYDEDEENPILTGAAEGFNRDKKQMGYRTGVMPMSFRVPFTESRFSYAKIEPFATALAAMVDIRNAWRRGDAAAIPMSVVGQIKEKTFLAGIADIIEAIQQPDSLRYWGANFAASWVPNIFKSTLRSADSTVPYRSITGEGTEANLQAVHRALQKTELPGIEDVPIVDLWGREAMRPGSPVGFMGSDFLWRMLSPVEYRSASINGADRAIINWNNQHPEDTFFPRAPRREWEARGGKKQKMTDQQYHDFAQLAGQTAKLALDRQRFDNVEKPTANDKETIMEVISAAQTAAKKQYAAVWQGEQAAPKAASELADEVVRRKVSNSREAATGKISFSRRRGETSLDAKDRFEKSKERKADARQDWQRFTKSP